MSKTHHTDDNIEDGEIDNEGDEGIEGSEILDTIDDNEYIDNAIDALDISDDRLSPKVHTASLHTYVFVCSGDIITPYSEAPALIHIHCMK